MLGADGLEGGFPVALLEAHFSDYLVPDAVIVLGGQLALLQAGVLVASRLGALGLGNDLAGVASNLGEPFINKFIASLLGRNS